MASAPTATRAACNARRDRRIRTGDPPLGRNDALPLVVCEEKIWFRSSLALLAA
jgi:hypothetical protein